MHATRTLMLALLVSASAVAQEPADLATQIKQLNAAVIDKDMSRDAEAQTLLAAIGSSYESLKPGDAKKAVKAVAKVLTRGRLRPPENTGVYRAAADSLGQMDVAGARVLRKVYDSKRFPNKPPWTHMRVALVTNIGKTKDEKMVSFLCDCVSRSSENEVLAAAGEALGRFDESLQKIRKEAARAIILKWGGLEVSKNQVVLARPGEPQSFVAQNAKATLEVCVPKWGPALTQLTGEKFADGVEWQHWYNKNKRANWDASPKAGH